MIDLYIGLAVGFILGALFIAVVGALGDRTLGAYAQPEEDHP